MAKQKDLDTELSLISFISLLSVLICSLLLTAIWVHVGSMNVKQAIGGQSIEKGKKNPAVWVKFGKGGLVSFQLQDAPRVARSLQRKVISGAADHTIDIVAVNDFVAKLRTKIPDLKTALIQPKSETVYEDIIMLMDNFKKAGLIDLGVAPL